MPGSPADWVAVLDRLLAGDQLACLEVSRLVTGVLQQLRAWDFRDEWDDLRQEVLLSIIENARAGRLRDRQAFLAYTRTITRNKFIDRVKRLSFEDQCHVIEMIARPYWLSLFARKS